MALKLLESSRGPLLEDFPEDAPDMTDQPQAVLQIACPVSFGPKKENLSAKELLLELFSEEFFQMNTWHEQALSKNKKTTTGISGLTPEAAVEFLSAFVRVEIVDNNIGNISVADGLLMAAEDIKAFYFDAVSAQPGQPTDSKSLAEWFWGQTSAAQVINEVRKISLKGDSKEMQLLGKLLLVPRNQMHRFKD